MLTMRGRHFASTVDKVLGNMWELYRYDKNAPFWLQRLWRAKNSDHGPIDIIGDGKEELKHGENCNECVRMYG